MRFVCAASGLEGGTEDGCVQDEHPSSPVGTLHAVRTLDTHGHPSGAACAANTTLALRILAAAASCQLLCPAHAVLGPTGGVKSGAFYGGRASRCVAPAARCSLLASAPTHSFCSGGCRWLPIQEDGGAPCFPPCRAPSARLPGGTAAVWASVDHRFVVHISSVCCLREGRAACSIERLSASWQDMPHPVPRA